MKTLTAIPTKHILILFIFCISSGCFAQKDTLSNRHFAAIQFGGQTIMSFHYEYSLVKRKYFALNTNVGLGINEYADDEDPNDRPIYGIHTGWIGLFGPGVVCFELGLYPTTYFYKSTTFVNLNAWTGVRFCPKRMEGFCMGLGYTPRLYYTYSDPNNRFFNATIGVKLGITF